jgi:hypothetical protein
MSKSLTLLILAVLAAFLYRWGVHRGEKNGMGLAGLKRPKALSDLVQTRPSDAGPLIGYGLSSGKATYSINGIPAEIDPFVSRKPVEQSAREYQDQWKAKGSKVNRFETDAIKVITALNEAERSFECAILIPNGDTDETLVIPAKMDLSVAPVEPRYRVSGYPAATRVLHLASQDFTGYSENLIQVSDDDPTSVADYYRDEMTRAGWQLDDSVDRKFAAPNSKFMFFLKGTDEMWINANRLDRENKTLVYMLYNDRY